ncbi:MAG: hypothetical protein GXO96_06665 [Nitrospirae bacterium]|nr:hypothetical protein [Candidatus Manganitrophaceae bacterium]
MAYELELLEAKIPEPFNGSLKLGINHSGKQAATLDLTWTKENFTAQFNGFGPGMPEPAHPTHFIKAAIDAINTNKQSPNESVENVFARLSPSFEI